MKTIVQMMAILTLICTVSGGASAAGKNVSEEDIINMCRAAANLCTETCNLNPTGGSASFSEALSNSLSCNDNCADSYGECVGTIYLKGQKENINKNKKKSTAPQ